MHAAMTFELRMRSSCLFSRCYLKSEWYINNLITLVLYCHSPVARENTDAHLCNIQPYCLLSNQIIYIYIYYSQAHIDYTFLGGFFNTCSFIKAPPLGFLLEKLACSFSDCKGRFVEVEQGILHPVQRKGNCSPLVDLKL